MNELFWALSDGADRKTFFFYAICALVALGQALLYRRASCFIAIRARFYQWNIHVETHRVNVVSSLIIVQSINHKVEAAEEGIAKSILLDASNLVVDLDKRVLGADRLLKGLALRHVDVVASEEELAVQVANVDGVKVNHSELLEASH